MGMSYKFFNVTVLMNLIYLAYLHSTPQERCKETGAGSNVCFDCFRSGTCVDNGDGTYSIENLVQCTTTPIKTYCDDSLFPSGPWGQCASYNPTSTNCNCSSHSECIPDPSNPNAILHCELDEPVTDDPCLKSALDLTTCSCLSCSDTCPFVDDPADNCASYFVCSESELIPINCTGSSCFDQASCVCVGIKGSTSIEPRTLTTTPTSCPADCPFLDNPDDDCGSYFVCSESELIPVNCTGSLCFDKTSCACVEIKGSTSIEPRTLTTPTSCPADCPFLDDPDDNCGSYFVCSGNELIPVECTDTLCFDQASCGCVVMSETTTIEPTPCSEDCPFLADISDCGRFFYCNGSTLVPGECPGTLCFDQSACQCR